MSSHIDNIEIEVTVSIMQKRGWSDGDTLAGYKRFRKGSMTYDEVVETVGNLLTNARQEVIAQFAGTRRVKELAENTRLRIEAANKETQ